MGALVGLPAPVGTSPCVGVAEASGVNLGVGVESDCVGVGALNVAAGEGAGVPALTPLNGSVKTPVRNSVAIRMAAPNTINSQTGLFRVYLLPPNLGKQTPPLLMLVCVEPILRNQSLQRTVFFHALYHFIRHHCKRRTVRIRDRNIPNGTDLRLVQGKPFL